MPGHKAVLVIWQTRQALLDLQHDILFANHNTAHLGTFCRQHTQYCQNLECTMAVCITSAQMPL